MFGYPEKTPIMSKKSISPVSNSDRGLIYTVKQSSEYKHYETYFEEERDISVINPEISRVKTPDRDTHFIVSFELDDEKNKTEGSLNFTLSDSGVIRTQASIDYYEDDEINEVEVLDLEDGEVVSERISV